MSPLQDKLAWPRRALLALALGRGLGELGPLPPQPRPQALAGFNPPPASQGHKLGQQDQAPGPRGGVWLRWGLPGKV